MRLLEKRRRAAQVWAFRKEVEDQAGPLFLDHANCLVRIHAPTPVVELAERAALDERDHAKRCAQICEELGQPSTDPPQSESRPEFPVILGDARWDDRRRALYTSVAMCCITETLATALLIEIRAVATMPLVRETVTRIVRDEVQHARLGWAHLAWEASHSDISWLSSHVPAMVRAAVNEHVERICTDDLSDYGVLPMERSTRLVQETLESVIYPGFSRVGLVDASWLRAPR